MESYNVPCSKAFLTMAITIATGINPRAPGWNIFRITDHSGFRTISAMLKWFVLELFSSKLFLEQL